jgi:replicative DNA helicase
MMKTGVALNFARSLCSETVDDQGVMRPAAKGIFFSLEMGDILLSQRLMSDMIFSHGHEVPYSRIRRGAISEMEFGHITTAATALAKLPLRIEQQGGIGISQVGSKARRLKRTSGLDFVIVDYLQLMGVADRYRGNRVNEVTELSIGLLKIAKDLDIAMIALCQLNRGVESREDKRPGLADLRESGSLEQDASVVMMLYREAYYLQNKEPRPGTPEYETWQNNMVRCINVLKIQIEKNRNGPTGEIECYVNPAVNAVRDLAMDQSLPDRGGYAF